MKGTVLSLGSVNADFEVRVEQPLGSAETMLAHDFLRMSGGKAANVAFIARLLGHDARLLACVGDDDLARQAMSPLEALGVETCNVARAHGVATGVSMIFVPKDGKKHIVLATNANDIWNEEAIQNALRVIDEAVLPSILVADYEVPATLVERAVSAAERRGIPVVLDPSFPDRADKALFARCTALTPNLSEACALAGVAEDVQDAPLQAAERLRSTGARLVCIKLSDGGCLVAEGETLTHIPPEPVAVVDSTGAGDAFTAAFAIALLEQRSSLEAAAFGVAAANLAVTAYGSQPSYAKRESIEKLAEQLRRKAVDCRAR